MSTSDSSNTGNSKLSISLVRSPAGWTGVGQWTDYHEYRVVYRGLLHGEHADGTIDVEAGQGLGVAPRRVGAILHARRGRRGIRHGMHAGVLARRGSSGYVSGADSYRVGSATEPIVPELRAGEMPKIHNGRSSLAERWESAKLGWRAVSFG